MNARALAVVSWIFAALFIAQVAVPADAHLHGGLAGPVNGPIVQAAEISFGAQTRTANGAVPLDNLVLANGSLPIDHYTICEVHTAYAAYWSANGAATANAAPTTIPIPDCNVTALTIFNQAVLATPTVAISPIAPGGAGTGTGYVVNDVLALTNGACLKVTLVSVGGVQNFTTTIQPNLVIQGTGAVTPQASNGTYGSCTQNTVGVGARFTYTYYQKALAIQPNTAGQTAHLGGNTTSLAYTHFNVVAVAANAASAATTITVDRIQDAVNFSTTGGSATDTTFGDGTTSTLQAFVHACVVAGRCTNSTGDLALLISTGAVISDPNVGPYNGKGQYGITIQDLNVRFALTTEGLSYAMSVPWTSRGNELDVMDACRATGTLLDGASFTSCTGGISKLTTLDAITLQGTVLACSGASASSGLDGVRTVGLFFSGTPLYNASSHGNAWTVQDACNVAADFNVADFKAHIDPVTGFMTTGPQGNFIAFGFNSGSHNGAGQPSSNHVFVRYNTALTASGCTSDNILTSGKGVLDGHVEHTWCRDWTGNGYTMNASQITYADDYDVGPYTYPGTSSHLDNAQYASTAISPNGCDFKRIMFMPAEGNGSTQGFWWGGATGIAGCGVDEYLMAGNSYSAHRRSGADTTTFPAAFSNTTTIRMNTNNPGTNTGGPNVFLKISSNSTPPNGTTFHFNAPCVLNPPYSNSASVCTPPPCATGFGVITGGSPCTAPYQFTIVLHTVLVNPPNAPCEGALPVGTCEVQIGASGIATMQNILNAFGASNGDICPSTYTDIAAYTLMCAKGPLASGGLQTTLISYFPGNSFASVGGWLPQGSLAVPSFTQGRTSNTAIENFPLAQGPDFWMFDSAAARSTHQGAVCGAVVFWCNSGDPTHIDSDVIWGDYSDPNNAGNAFVCSEAALPGYTNPTYVATTTDMYIVGADQGCYASTNGVATFSGTTMHLIVIRGSLVTGSMVFNAINAMTDGSTIISQSSGPAGGSGDYVLSRSQPNYAFNSGAVGTASVSSGVMTVIALSSGAYVAGQGVFGTSGAGWPTTTGVTITSQLTGTPGGIGTYQLGTSFNASSVTVNAGAAVTWSQTAVPTSGLFNGDSPTNTAQIQLESITQAQYAQTTPLPLCQFHVAVATPAVNGLLTPGGNAGLSKTVGAYNTSGLWNKSGTDPCAHLSSTNFYAYPF